MHEDLPDTEAADFGFAVGVFWLTNKVLSLTFLFMVFEAGHAAWNEGGFSWLWSFNQHTILTSSHFACLQSSNGDSMLRLLSRLPSLDLSVGLSSKFTSCSAVLTEYE